MKETQQNSFKITCGGWFSTLLMKNGTLFAFGQNGSMELGIESTNNQPTPVQVKAVSDIKDVACGYYATILLTRNGEVWMCGYLGEGWKTSGYRLIYSNPKTVAIFCGGFHAMILTENGDLLGIGGLKAQITFFLMHFIHFLFFIENNGQRIFHFLISNFSFSFHRRSTGIAHFSKIIYRTNSDHE